MKIKLFLSALAIATAISACQNQQSTKQNTDTLGMAAEHVTDSSEGTRSGTTVPPSSRSKQPASSNGTQAIIASYLELKNTLVKDDDKAAASAGNKIVQALNAFDKSSLSGDQAKEYKEIEDDAREHAEHVAKNAGNIKHQREHFELLSSDIYDLVNAFGGGRALYLEHCPMYNNNKGANWISETKKIANPYLGKAMLTCGIVKEELKM